MNCEQRIGVTVRASTSERSTAAEIVMPNWKKNRPMMPLMNATGRKIATTATVAASAAKVISPRAVARGEYLALAHLAMAHDVFEHHDCVVDHDANGEREAEQGEEIEGEAHEIEHGKRAHDRGSESKAGR